jgi:hypothetical protein
MESREAGKQRKDYWIYGKKHAAVKKNGYGGPLGARKKGRRENMLMREYSKYVTGT